jgi:hypothetical protein
MVEAMIQTGGFMQDEEMGAGETSQIKPQLCDGDNI